MIIGACGYGNTGSSVLTDLMKEYRDVQVFDEYEFILPYRVDGLGDLEYHLMKQYAKNLSSDFAIKRFLEMAKCYKTPLINKPCKGDVFEKLSSQYIDRISQVQYIGTDTADVLSGNVLKNILAFASKKVLMPKVIEKLTHKRSYIWPCRKMYYAVEPENFYKETKAYVKEILRAMGANTEKIICLDQPFEGNSPENSFPFFDNPYAIVIDRDPRDLYFEYKYNNHPDVKYVPNTTVEDFVIYYKNMRKNKTTSKSVLRLNFEEFIYEYDETISKVEEFLQLGEHSRPRQFFDPSKSINNTQQIRKHPEDIDNVKYIEENLEEFLFPFQNYPNVEFTGGTFYGAGRKMVKEDKNFGIGEKRRRQ